MDVVEHQAAEDEVKPLIGKGDLLDPPGLEGDLQPGLAGFLARYPEHVFGDVDPKHLACRSGLGFAGEVNEPVPQPTSRSSVSCLNPGQLQGGFAEFASFPSVSVLTIRSYVPAQPCMLPDG